MEAAREMIAKFKAPPNTPLINLPAEFVPLTDQFAEVTDRPPQVINEDSPAINAGGGG